MRVMMTSTSRQWWIAPIRLSNLVLVKKALKTSDVIICMECK